MQALRRARQGEGPQEITAFPTHLVHDLQLPNSAKYISVVEATSLWHFVMTDPDD